MPAKHSFKRFGGERCCPRDGFTLSRRWIAIDTTRLRALLG
ncbi:hypothetical protein ACWDTI_26930 [Gordonia sp. NPDC003424]